MSQIPHDLFLKLQQGDQYAWDILIQTYHSRLVVFAARQVPRNDAEDVVQAFWVKLQNNICSLNFLKTSYLYGGVTLEILNYRRKQACRRDNVSFSTLSGQNEDGESRAYDPPDTRQQEGSIDMSSISEIMDKAGLKPVEEQVLILRYLEGHSRVEVAGMLGISKETVTNHVNRARNKILEHYSQTEK